MIKTNNLTKIFTLGENKLIALNKINLHIKGGEFVAITGMSGSGKSTLLYQLSLLDNPTKGKVILDGVDTMTLTDQEKIDYRLKHLGYIFQDYAILPSLTARENVMMPLLMKGFNNDMAKKLADASLEKVGLENKINNLPSQMSGGQQQRVSIARSIVHNPKILFADEPTANLDTESSENVIDIFKDLNKHGQTIIMVTHEPEYAKSANRNIELRDGVIVKEQKIKT